MCETTQIKNYNVPKMPKKKNEKTIVSSKHKPKKVCRKNAN